MKRGALLLLLVTAAGFAAPAVAAEPLAAKPGHRCYFAKSQRRAELTTKAGARVELYRDVLTIDGRELSPCDGLPRSHPSALAPFAAGFAVAFRAGGIWTWQDGVWSTLPNVPRGPVRALAAQGDALWIGTQGAGLVRWSEGKASAVAGLPRGAITALLAPDEHTLHVGIDMNGWWTLRDGSAPELRDRRAVVGCFHEIAGKVRAAAHPEGCQRGPEHGLLPSAHVTALATLSGRLMVGTFDSGIFSFAPPAAPMPLAGAPRFVNALALQGDTLFVASPSGLYRTRAGKACERVHLAAREPHVNGLFAGKDGTLWLATSNGVAGVSARGVRWFDERHGLPARIVYAVTETYDGALWAATAGGVARLSAQGAQRFSAESGHLPQNWVTALLAEGDAVVAGTYSAGVVRLRANGKSEVMPALAASWTNPAGLLRAGGALLVATLGGGLLTENGEPAFTALPSTDVTSVLAEGGVIWVGTRGGLFRSEAPLR